MNDKEMSELDKWICVHVLGWEERQVYFGSSKVEGQTFWVAGGRRMTSDSPSHHHKFQPVTTDYAGALKVFERCINRFEHNDIEFGSRPDNKSFWFRTVVKQGSHVEGEAGTLPLAICLFAKALFSEK